MKWLRNLWSSAPAEPSEKAPVVLRPVPGQALQAAARRGEQTHELDAGEAAFLIGLTFQPPRRDDEELTRDDRIFLDGIAARVDSGDLGVPVLPQVALQLSAMLRKGDVPISEYVALLNQDPALCVEVLRCANSALYGGSSTTSSLQEAILRIGLTRLQSILMVANLRARILKGGAYQRKAELLLDLAIPTAVLASRLSPDPAAADQRFMRGLLMHVEHLVIIGLIGEIAREHRTAIAPSIEAVFEAFDRFGPAVRGAVAVAWDLRELLTGGEDAQALAAEYAGLRYAVICRWLGQPLPPLPGVDSDRLARLLSPIQPRSREIAKPQG